MTFDWSRATPEQMGDAVRRARVIVPEWEFGAAWPPGAGPFEPLEGDTEVSTGDLELRSMVVDWPTFWSADMIDAEWLYEPVVARGRAHALYATGGTGKSLLALNIATTVALAGHRVLYVDYEMTADDLLERLEAMGYGPTTNLASLFYILTPDLPPADTVTGGARVVRAANLFDVELVVFDTFARAVTGDENEADTIRAFYRHTGAPLKAAGRAFLRIDHAGKMLERGQRGSSAKNDDVDVVWEMVRRDGDAFRLTARKRRMGWVPETVDMMLDPHTATFVVTSFGTWPAGTDEAAEILDELGVPLDFGRPKAARMVRDAGRQIRNGVLSAALKYRRQRLENLSPSRLGEKQAETGGTAERTGRDTPTEPQVSDTGQVSGTGGDRSARPPSVPPPLPIGEWWDRGQEGACGDEPPAFG